MRLSLPPSDEISLCFGNAQYQYIFYAWIAQDIIRISSVHVDFFMFKIYTLN